MDENDQLIESLILNGALEVAGIDFETGEPLYNFTDKLEDVDPILHSTISTYFSTEAMALWEHGFLEMDVTEKNPLVRLTEKIHDQKEILKLNLLYYRKT